MSQCTTGMKKFKKKRILGYLKNKKEGKDCISK
jgi:ubiquitin